MFVSEGRDVISLADGSGYKKFNFLDLINCVPWGKG
jgi:hypothetical protein